MASASDSTEALLLLLRLEEVVEALTQASRLLATLAGSTGTVSTGNVVFVGSGPISLSQSTGAAGSAATNLYPGPATSSLSATGAVSISTNGSTISIGVPSAVTFSNAYFPYKGFDLAAGIVGQGSLLFDPVDLPI